MAAINYTVEQIAWSVRKQSNRIINILKKYCYF